MTLSDLTACVVKVNDDGFKILESEHLLSPALVKKTKAARVYGLRPPPPAGGSLMCPGQAGRCFEGVATGGHGNPTALEKTISLGAPLGAPPFHRVAVGAVIDIDKSKTGSGGATAGHADLDENGLEEADPNEADPDEADADLPVVLAVGINYGQQGRHNFVLHPPKLRDSTAMRPRLNAVVSLLKGIAPKLRPLGNGYHLVAANFFPWITTKSWNACTRSALTEELLLRYFGWPNPRNFIDALIGELQSCAAHLPPAKGLTHVIFHGAQNTAMRCGLALTSHLTRHWAGPLAKLPLYRCYSAVPPVPPLSHYSHLTRRGRTGPDVIFCDNLAPSPMGLAFRNAVWLWQ